MSNTYIIGDVHGNYNGLMKSLQDAGWKENEDKLIFVGDLVDRVYSHDGEEMLAEHRNTLYVFGHVPHDKIITTERKHSGCTYLDIDLSPEKVGIVRLSDVV